MDRRRRDIKPTIMNDGVWGPNSGYICGDPQGSVCGGACPTHLAQLPQTPEGLT